MATADTSVVALYEYKFTQIFELLAQQRTARIVNTFRQGVHTGSQQAQAVKQIGLLTPTRRTQRGQPVSYADVFHDDRWVVPNLFNEYVLFDKFDELQTQADPRSTYVESLMAGMNRQHDAECIRAFFETSKTGQLGADTTAFPSGNIVASNFGASADTGLTVAKLREARRLLLSNEVDLEADTLHVVAAATQLDNLLAEAQVINRDFNQPDAPVLEEGKITRFLGMNFIHSELLNLDSTAAYRMVPVYAASGMHFGTWEGITTKIVQADWLEMAPWQVGIWAGFGACRLQEKKVMQINCLK
jgi:hypothetical protein